MKKRIISLLLCAVLMLGVLPNALAAPAMWDGSVADSFAGGTGTAEDPYQIENGAQLAYLAQLVNEGNEEYNAACYELTADIDLNGSEEQQWTPIGLEGSSQNYPFKGQFDGKGHKITGLYINDSNKNGVGLFGRSALSVIRNISVYGSVTGKSNVGGIVGANYTGLIENCRNYAAVSGLGSVGGVAGGNRSYNTDGETADVNNCVNAGLVQGKSQNVGGIVGQKHQRHNRKLRSQRHNQRRSKSGQQ